MSSESSSISSGGFRCQHGDACNFFSEIKRKSVKTDETNHTDSKITNTILSTGLWAGIGAFSSYMNDSSIIGGALFFPLTFQVGNLLAKKDSYSVASVVEDIAMHQVSAVLLGCLFKSYGVYVSPATFIFNLMAKTALVYVAVRSNEIYEEDKREAEKNQHKSYHLYLDQNLGPFSEGAIPLIPKHVIDKINSHNEISQDEIEVSSSEELDESDIEASLEVQDDENMPSLEDDQIAQLPLETEIGTVDEELHADVDVNVDFNSPDAEETK